MQTQRKVRRQLRQILEAIHYIQLEVEKTTDKVHQALLYIKQEKYWNEYKRIGSELIPCKRKN